MPFELADVDSAVPWVLLVDSMNISRGCGSESCGALDCVSTPGKVRLSRSRCGKRHRSLPH